MGLDLSHIIPVKFDEPYDGDEIIEYEELHKYSRWRTAFENYLTDDKELGCYRLYYKELGSQRKGVSPKFYDLFEDGFYFDLMDFQKVYTLLEADQIHTLKELQDNFQENFLNNYVTARSVLFISY